MSEKDLPKSQGKEKKKNNNETPIASPKSSFVQIPDTRSWTRRNFVKLCVGFTAVNIGGTVVLLKMTHDLRQRTNELALLNVDQKSRPKPTVMSEDPDLQKFLSSRFEVISGTAPFEKAKIVGFGEMHLDLKKRNGDGPEAKALQQIAMRGTTSIAIALQKTVQSGDHILVEGISPKRGDTRPGLALHPSLAFMGRGKTKDVMASGWDDEDLINKDEPATIRQRSRERNKTVMFPTMMEQSQKRKGRIYVIAGSGHFIDDPDIDAFLQKAGIPYILLGEKGAMEELRKLGIVKP